MIVYSFDITKPRRFLGFVSSLSNEKDRAQFEGWLCVSAPLSGRGR